MIFNQGCFVFAEYQSIQAVQAAMILSTIFCCVAFLVFILQLFRLKQGERFVLTSVIQLLSCKWFFYTFDLEDIFMSVGKQEIFQREQAAWELCSALEAMAYPS